VETSFALPDGGIQMAILKNESPTALRPNPVSAYPLSQHEEGAVMAEIFLLIWLSCAPGYSSECTLINVRRFTQRDELMVVIEKKEIYHQGIVYALPTGKIYNIQRDSETTYKYRLLKTEGGNDN